MLHLRNLNESLDKMYSLNEAYGESWPKWLKNGFNSSATNYGVASLSDSPRNLGAVATKRNPKGGEAPKSEFKRDRGDYRSNAVISLQNSIFNAARDSGIDLQNATVTEVPVEDAKKYTRKSKSGDPTKICIWGFPNGQVYIEGLNETEKYLDDAKQLPFQWMSLKNLMNEAIHLAYFETSELNPDLYIDKDIQRDRTYRKMSKLYSEHPEMANMNRQEDRHFVNNNTEGNIDKSGYLVSPSRYKDALEKARESSTRISKYSIQAEQELDSLYRHISRAWKGAVRYMSNSDPFSNWHDVSLNSFDTVIHKYNDIARIMQNFTQDVIQRHGTESAVNLQRQDQFYQQVIMTVYAIEQDISDFDLDNKTINSVNWLR